MPTASATVSFSILQPLPCSSCHSECCGTVPLSEADVRRIRLHLAGQPAAEVERVKAQQRGPLTCPFVDTDHWRCFVYEARPAVCRLFGAVPEMPCPYAVAPPRDRLAMIIEASLDVDATTVVGLASWEMVR